MARKNPKKVAIEEAASKLSLWSSIHQTQDHPYVNGLLAALNKQSHLDYWAEFSAVENLPNPPIKDVERFERAIDRINHFKNVMIFLPIAFTWASISLATTSYAHFTKAHSTVNLNFLDYWENGYSSLPGIWRLSNVAIIDFLIILSIIISSVLGIFIGQRISTISETALLDVDAERFILGTEIDLALRPFKLPTPQLMSASLNRSIQQLNLATKALLSASKEIQKSAKIK